MHGNSRSVKVEITSITHVLQAFVDFFRYHYLSTCSPLWYK